MKKVFQYIGLIVLMAFSFYYAQKVAYFMNGKDEIMKSINEYAQKYDTECIEGYITEEGVVLGVSGLVVDTVSSYAEMKGIGFDTSLIEYKNNPCVVSKENNKEDFIIRGNEIKNSISLIIDIENGKNIERILQVAQTKNIKLSVLVDKNYIKNNKEYIKKLINEKIDVLYKGNSEEDLEEFLKYYKEINREAETFCIYEGNEKIKDYCYKNNLNTIKPTKSYDAKYLASIKNNLNKGDIIVLSESTMLRDEIGVVINYIRSRGYKISSVREHLSD